MLLPENTRVLANYRLEIAEERIRSSGILISNLSNSIGLKQSREIMDFE